MGRRRGSRLDNERIAVVWDKEPLQLSASAVDAIGAVHVMLASRGARILGAAECPLDK